MPRLRFVATMATAIVVACSLACEGENTGEGEGEGDDGIADAPNGLFVVVTGDTARLRMRVSTCSFAAANAACFDTGGDEEDECVYGCVDRLVSVVDDVARVGAPTDVDDVFTVDVTGWRSANDAHLELGGCGDDVVVVPLVAAPPATLTDARVVLARGEPAVAFDVDADQGTFCDGDDIFGFTCCASPTPGPTMTAPIPRTGSVNAEEGREAFASVARELDGVSTSAVSAIRVFQTGDSALLTGLSADVVVAGADVRGVDPEALISRDGFAFELTAITASRTGDVPTALHFATADGSNVDVIAAGDGTDVVFADGSSGHSDADVEGSLVEGDLGARVDFDGEFVVGASTVDVVVHGSFVFVTEP